MNRKVYKIKCNAFPLLLFFNFLDYSPEATIVRNVKVYFPRNVPPIYKHICIYSILAYIYTMCVLCVCLYFL